MHVSIIGVLEQLGSKKWSAIKLLISLALCLSLLLGGCSVVQSLFENSPQLLYWWIDAYVDFDGSQARQVKAALKSLQTQVRQNQLALVLEQVQAFERAAPGELSPELSCQALPFLLSQVPPLLHALTPALAEILPNLSETQLKHIRKHFDDQNKDWSDEWLKPSATKVLDQQTEKGIDQAQDLYGSLSSEQKQLIRSLAKASGYNATTALAIRLEHQSLILSTLNQIRDSGNTPLAMTEMEDLLQSWAQKMMHSPNPELRAYQDSRASYNCHAVSEFHANTTPEQRLRAEKKLKRYEKDLLELMANHKP